MKGGGLLWLRWLLRLSLISCLRQDPGLCLAHSSYWVGEQGSHPPNQSRRRIPIIQLQWQTFRPKYTNREKGKQLSGRVSKRLGWCRCSLWWYYLNAISGVHATLDVGRMYTGLEAGSPKNVGGSSSSEMLPVAGSMKCGIEKPYWTSWCGNRMRQTRSALSIDGRE